MLLLGASYYFYMCWKIEYLVLILISTVIDYIAGIQMGKYSEKSKRKPFLLLSLFINLGLLFSFKYFNFFSNALSSILNSFGIIYDAPILDVLLPVGISFYTFQTLSYTFDVYRGTKKPERHFGIFALYVAFFPQLVAGPIERSVRLLPQFFKKFDFDYQRVTSGLKLMTWGFFKKLVIADQVAILVNQVYNNPENYTGVPLLLATYFFAFQIYCDFSGYSDIAIGAARVMGFKLMDNFRQPYLSKSISEFWRRWHISLSTWFRDYLYIPLGGSRVMKYRWYFNLMIVFIISGLWHGSNWTFLIWGGLHGFYYVFSVLTKGLRERIIELLRLNKYPFVHKVIKVGLTFHLVLFSWIFFRANSLADAFYIIKNIFVDFEVKFGGYNMGLGIPSTLLAIFFIILMELVHFIGRNKNLRTVLMTKPVWIRWGLYYAVILIILCFGVYGQNEFIYFQF